VRHLEAEFGQLVQVLDGLLHPFTIVARSNPDLHDVQAHLHPGDSDVMVHGAGAAQALLRAGQLDELELHVVPVLLVQGRRLLDNLPEERIDLDLVRRLTTPDVEELAQRVTHLRYRVRRP